MVENKAQSVLRARPFLIKAIENNELNTMERIFNANYPIDEAVQETLKTTPLMHAACKGQKEGLDSILNRNPDVERRDRAGKTVVHYCCQGGNIQNLQYLMTKEQIKPLVESRTQGGTTPLMYAVSSGNIYMVGECLN